MGESEILHGLQLFYLTMAVLALAFAILLYPVLRKGSRTQYERPVQKIDA